MRGAFGGERPVGELVGRGCVAQCIVQPRRRAPAGALALGHFHCHGPRGDQRRHALHVGHGNERDRKSTRLNSSHLVISYAVSLDRKSTRLNSSHLVISYAVFCLKKKKKQKNNKYQIKQHSHNSKENK